MDNAFSPWMIVEEEVAQALADGRPVVALESCVWAQGLPRPMNYDVARETCKAVVDCGAVPAVVAILDGKIRIGLTASELEDMCRRRGFAKVGVGDLPGAIACRQNGATTVSASLLLAEKAGIRVFATGGLGGIHPNWTTHIDVSADLGQLARSRSIVVCSGVKAVLDIPSTIEVFEALGLPLALYNTEAFPRFYTSGIPVGIGFKVTNAQEVVEAYKVSIATLERGLVLANPVPADKEVDASTVKQLLEAGMRQAEAENRTGKGVTPFLLDYLARESHGATLEANRALLVGNAVLAAEIASELRQPQCCGHSCSNNSSELI